jgi:hypothetical protein
VADPSFFVAVLRSGRRSARERPGGLCDTVASVSTGRVDDSPTAARMGCRGRKASGEGRLQSVLVPYNGVAEEKPSPKDGSGQQGLVKPFQRVPVAWCATALREANVGAVSHLQYTWGYEVTSMNRRWNALIWAGFAIIILALVSYIPLFVLFPITRDVPWVNYLLFLLGGWLLAAGLGRAFRDPEHYRGRISGSILGALSILLIVFFIVSILYFGKKIPSPESALRTGQIAPSFTLQDAVGKQVSSSDLLKQHHALVLVFYRGYW